MIMSMRYKIFGRRTGLRESELALGAGNFGTRWGHGAERPQAKKVFDAEEMKKTYDRRIYVEDACSASYSPEWTL